MIDQANKLRDLVKSSREAEEAKAGVQDQQASVQQPVESLGLTSRVITVTSGKGGVGKTNFTTNLAIQFAKYGKRVVIIDTDFGLANIEILFGLIPKYSFADVLYNGKTIYEILTPGPMGIQFLSGGSGLGELANISNEQVNYLLENFAVLDTLADVVLIDTGAGISNVVMNFIKASSETVIITTPEPTSITDAYAIMKMMKESGSRLPSFKIVVNRADSEEEGKEIFAKLNMVTERFLSMPITDLGAIPTDRQLVQAVKQQKPVSICFPQSESAKAIDRICCTLLNVPVNKDEMSKEGIKTFFKRLVNIFGS